QAEPNQLRLVRAGERQWPHARRGAGVVRVGRSRHRARAGRGGGHHRHRDTRSRSRLMCGLVGVVNRDGAEVAPDLVGRMSDMLAHRGADGAGQYCDGPVGLGHRRLAIIDLSAAGHQPMVSPDGGRVLAYNGEVFNFRELRAELEVKGHEFRSHTDTEVVLHALDEWGSRAVERFNGMFAFAALDRTRHEVVLARDRYGIKPLYYTVL